MNVSDLENASKRRIIVKEILKEYEKTNSPVQLSNNLPFWNNVPMNEKTNFGKELKKKVDDKTITEVNYVYCRTGQNHVQYTKPYCCFFLAKRVYRIIYQ
jgi:hypothetical protein